MRTGMCGYGVNCRFSLLDLLSLLQDLLHMDLLLYPFYLHQVFHIQVANLVTLQGEGQPFVRNVMTLKSCSPIVRVDVMSFGTEREVLLAWRCADANCHVLQHILCVIIPEESWEGIPLAPPHFYCEVCRINRADPVQWWLVPSCS